MKDVRVKVGGTTLAGDISYDRSGERPLLKAALLSESADFDDLASLAGMRPTKTAARPPQKKDDAAVAEKPAAAGAKPMFSDKPLPVKALNTLDAEVSLALKKLKVAAFPAVESLKLRSTSSQVSCRSSPSPLASRKAISRAVSFSTRVSSPCMPL